MFCCYSWDTCPSLNRNGEVDQGLGKEKWLAEKLGKEEGEETAARCKKNDNKKELMSKKCSLIKSGFVVLLSIMWVPGIEYRLSDSVAATYAY